MTKHALDGSKKNAGLLLRNCPKCRAERKAGGPGSRGGNSRPTAGTAPAVQSASSIEFAELETLRTANATMKEELDGLYMQLKELRQRLASYEPVPAPAAPKPVQEYRLPPEHLTMGQFTERRKTSAELLQQWIAKK